MAMNDNTNRHNYQEIVNQDDAVTFMATATIAHRDVLTIDDTIYLGVKPTAATTDVAIGTALAAGDATSGNDNSVPVQTFGPVPKLVIATGQTINYGDYVGPAAGGKIAKITAGSGLQMVGISIGPDGSNAGDLIPVILTGGQLA